MTTRCDQLIEAISVLLAIYGMGLLARCIMGEVAARMAEREANESHKAFIAHVRRVVK